MNHILSPYCCCLSFLLILNSSLRSDRSAKMTRPSPLFPQPNAYHEQQQHHHHGMSQSSSTVTPAELPAAASPSPNHPTQISLQQPSPKKKPSKPGKLLRRVRSAFRTLPILSSPTGCKMPTININNIISSTSHGGGGSGSHHHGYGGADNQTHMHGGTRMTGTLFGYRKASRINLAIQENSKCIPMLILELAIPTARLLQEMGSGLVRIALECEKRHPTDKSTKMIEEPLWTMYCNGKKTGYGIKREPSQEDLNIMQMLHAVSMGAGVLPSASGAASAAGGGGDDGDQSQSEGVGGGELTYMRANFERVIGSKDSETFYMMNPDGNSGPELSIFFVRV